MTYLSASSVGAQLPQLLPHQKDNILYIIRAFILFLKIHVGWMVDVSFKEHGRQYTVFMVSMKGGESRCRREFEVNLLVDKMPAWSEPVCHDAEVIFRVLCGHFVSMTHTMSDISVKVMDMECYDPLDVMHLSSSSSTSTPPETSSAYLAYLSPQKIDEIVAWSILLSIAASRHGMKTIANSEQTTRTMPK